MKKRLPKCANPNCDERVKKFWHKYHNRSCAVTDRHRKQKLKDPKGYHLAAVNRGKKSVKYCRENKIGCFFNDKLRRQVARKGRKRTRELYPNLSSETLKKTHQKYPNMAHENGKKAVVTCRKNKIGFFDAEAQRRMHEKSHKTCKKNKKGFFDPKIQSKGGKRGSEICRKNKKGMFFDPEIHKRAGKRSQEVQHLNPKKVHEDAVKRGLIGGPKIAEINKKLKKGFWSPKIQSMGGKKCQELLKLNPKKSHEIHSNAGFAAVESNRKNKPYRFMQTLFDSGQEKYFFQQLFFNLGFVPIERENSHVKLNGGEIDAKLWDYIFIEWHSWNKKLTPTEYYISRRKLLDENGFKENPLIVIINIKQLYKILEVLNGKTII